jgi:hypothetical protein
MKIDKDCKLIIYADDNATFYAHEDLDVFEQNLSSNLKNRSK